jgi:hypothetical protein
LTKAKKFNKANKFIKNFPKINQKITKKKNTNAVVQQNYATNNYALAIYKKANNV